MRRLAERTGPIRFFSNLLGIAKISNLFSIYLLFFHYFAFGICRYHYWFISSLPFAFIWDSVWLICLLFRRYVILSRTSLRLLCRSILWRSVISINRGSFMTQSSIFLICIIENIYKNNTSKNNSIYYIEMKHGKIALIRRVNKNMYKMQPKYCYYKHTQSSSMWVMNLFFYCTYCVSFAWKHCYFFNCY